MRALVMCALTASCIGFGSALAQSLSMPEHAAALPPGDGREIIAVSCTQCHSLTPIVGMRDGPIGWQRHVRNMVLRGAQLNGSEIDAVVAYLSGNFGPGQSLPPPKPVVLAEGAGKTLIETRCTVCHDLERVTVAKRDKATWTATVHDMYARFGFTIPDEEAAIASYLSEHYGTP